jgi:hypothetical protein
MSIGMRHFATQAAAGADRWRTRLESLRPEQPMAYFELAEEIADAAAESDEADRDLARRLFALAGALESKSLGRSACLAMAELESDEQARLRLLALAELLDANRFTSLPDAQHAGAVRPAGRNIPALRAATEALSRYREGQGALAITAARRPGVMPLLESGSAALPGGLARFMEDCKVYRGQLKPTLTNEDINAMLRLEAAWLAGDDRSWSSELFLTRGKPLIEVDPDRLEESLGVDASRSVYRNGAWARP